MDICLQDRTAVVTGASKGIGARIAVDLAAAGAAVVVNYRTDAAGADRVVEAITEAGGRALAVRADVSRSADVTALFEAARDAFGTVGILVNNAAISVFGPIEAITEEDYRRHVDINLWGTLLTMRTLAGQPGLGHASIINVSTAGTTFHPPYGALYVATKAAVNAATLVAAAELGPRGIRVNALLPGYSDTEGTRAMGFVGSPAADQAVSGVPLGRLGTPGDYGPPAVFLASDAARFITGAVVHVSGGRR
ncbi:MULTISPECIES: SDR family NAD(P)-dependent oxidoreductase [Catenuloplanes]|uniref:3-oxoacyl-[acyl-carrier protein] reductase n=1 Tax=Catenuloplanes niger TaxID=587534 RepID=A0AAE3ZPK8_9ACTN|nr:SDR family oxidoreductase [Catenuloplanes niger]MDR7322742.1 3-oxoacyl-[acyl-carrier protein] reductase [Catenuloplanes niger]